MDDAELTQNAAVFVAGYALLFVGLTALVDLGAPAELAAALALSIAGGATVVFLPAAIDNARELITPKGV